jgi:AAA family ATP:ADP antiporter
VLFPNAKAIHPDLSELSSTYPAFKYIFLIVGHWSYSLFYIMSELWGSVMLSLMFWQLANQICTVQEAKKFYALFGFIGQIGLIGSGVMLGVFNGISEGSWNITLNYVTVSVLIAGIGLSLVLQLLGSEIGFETINALAAKKKNKVKLGFIQSIQFIAASKHIRSIALLVLCYGVSINLVEGLWKKQLQIHFPNKGDIATYMGQVQIWTGWATVVAMLLGSYSLRFFKWSSVAIVSPLMILATGAIFFIFVIFSQVYTSANVFSIDPSNLIFFAVMVGALQNILSKAFKYSFFDPTKEIAYIPLDEESKVKGKAAVDVIGGRLGKSGGAVVQQFILTMATAFAGVGSEVASEVSLITISPYMFGVFMFVMVIWIYAVTSLSRLLKGKI